MKKLEQVKQEAKERFDYLNSKKKDNPHQWTFFWLGYLEASYEYEYINQKFENNEKEK